MSAAKTGTLLAVIALIIGLVIGIGVGYGVWGAAPAKTVRFPRDRAGACRRRSFACGSRPARASRGCSSPSRRGPRGRPRGRRQRTGPPGRPVWPPAGPPAGRVRHAGEVVRIQFAPEIPQAALPVVESPGHAQGFHASTGAPVVAKPYSRLSCQPYVQASAGNR